MIQFETSRTRRGLAAAALPLLIVASFVVHSENGRPVDADVHPTCRAVLAGHERLVYPRQLKLGRDVLEYGLRDEKTARLLRSLSRVFTELTPERMAVMGHALRGMPSQAWQIFVPHELNPFFHAYPELIDRAVLDNYTILFREFLGQSLDAFDVGLLATLLKDQPRTVLADEADEGVLFADEESMLKRLRGLVERPAYRDVLAHLLDDPTLQEALRRDAIRTNQYDAETADGIPPLLTNIARHVRQRSVDRFEARIIYQAIRVVTAGMEGFAVERDLFDHAFTATRLKRDGYLIVARQYLASRRLPYTTGALIDLLDHVYFGSPLPIETNAVYHTVLEAARRLVLPLKHEFGRSRGPRPPAPVPASTAKPFELHLIDFNPPAPESKRVARLRASATATSTPPPLALASPTFEHPLAPFTSFTETPADGELAPGLIYEFKFLRGPETSTQRVRFGPEALDFFRVQPRSRRAFLNALHMGYGIKELWAERRRGPERVYELKTTGSYRGLMMVVDRTWQLITIVHKDDVDRAAASLSAL